ncbi:MAG: rubrerythrin [Euryarchaeota archaeon]|nr:rubrerythrin [Euryarchaeota archaeon]
MNTFTTLASVLWKKGGSVDELIRMVEEAIESEKGSQERYRRAAQEARDPETKVFFEQLVRDEERHERLLRERLKTLKLLRGF